MALCSVQGCGRSARAMGYCGLHYQRTKSGKPLLDPKKTPSGSHLAFLNSLLSHAGDECVRWPFAAQTPQGYGVILYEGRSMGAHRAMCMIAHGLPKSEGLEACHSCGKGHEGCVNPRHLRWGTCADNKADMLIHGTRLRGERCGTSSLSDRDVIRIDRDLKLGLRKREISRMYGVNDSCIRKIEIGQRWSWLTGRNSSSPTNNPLLGKL